jgi:hypothetical protein
MLTSKHPKKIIGFLEEIYKKFPFRILVQTTAKIFQIKNLENGQRRKMFNINLLCHITIKVTAE